MFDRLSKMTAGLVGLALCTGSALAQESSLPIRQIAPVAPVAPVESKPGALTEMEREGVSVIFLGRRQGLDGWLLRKGDDLQTVYSTPDGQALVIGTLYDAEGQPITAGQLEAIPDLVSSQTAQGESQNAELHTRLIAAHGPVFGRSGPLFHVFMDPRCPYCHGLWQDAFPLINAGRMRLHVIPVGILGPASQQLCAQILSGPSTGSGPDAGGEPSTGSGSIADNWQLVMQDRTGSIHAPDLLSGERRLEQNHALFVDWKGRGVPLLIFERNGELLVMSGRPDSLDALLE